MTSKRDQRTLFRAVAIAEALSWGALLVGVYFKRIAQSSDVGVHIFGPVHGVIVLAYLLTVIYVGRSFRWGIGTFLLAIVASVPPFTTVVFGRWADRRGLLGTAESSASAKENASIVT